VEEEAGLHLRGRAGKGGKENNQTFFFFFFFFFFHITFTSTRHTAPNFPP